MRFGSFSPTGAVLCSTCSSTSPGDAWHHEHQGWCDRCGGSIVLDRSDVARMTRVRRALGGAGQIWQTGGMCAAFVVQPGMIAGGEYDPARPLVVLGEDLIVLYPNEQAFDEGEAPTPPVDTAKMKDGEVIATVRMLLSVLATPVDVVPVAAQVSQ